MKKTIVGMFAIGLAMSILSVQAESENESGHERVEEQGISMSRYSLGVRQNYETAAYVTDDVKVPSVAESGSVYPLNEQPQALRVSSLTRLKGRAAQLIKERISSLNANAKAITASKTLTVEQKGFLTASITTNINGLTSLGVTIASSTDATSAKALVNTIYTSFRIYGVTIPQIRLEKRIYDLQNHSLKLSDTFLKVQTKINEYKGKGKDVTVWQKSLDDAKMLVANDMNTLANTLVKIKALTPTDYATTSKMVISAANTDLKNVAKDFNTIAKTLNKTKMLKNPSGTASSTVSVTPVTTPAPSSAPFTLAQVAGHASRNDCWIIVEGKVYAVSSYISMHPGGSSAIANYCGQDATTGFNTRGGTGTHSSGARSILGGFLVGTV